MAGGTCEHGGQEGVASCPSLTKKTHPNMKNLLATLAALLAFTAAAYSGDSNYSGGGTTAQSGGGIWWYPLDCDREGRRERGDVRYRGVTEWNLVPAQHAAAVARRSPGFIPTPAPLFSGAGTPQPTRYYNSGSVNYRSGYYNSYPNYRGSYYNAYPNYRNGRYYYGY